MQIHNRTVWSYTLINTWGRKEVPGSLWDLLDAYTACNMRLSLTEHQANSSEQTENGPFWRDVSPCAAESLQWKERGHTLAPSIPRSCHIDAVHSDKMFRAHNSLGFLATCYWSVKKKKIRVSLFLRGSNHQEVVTRANLLQRHQMEPFLDPGSRTPLPPSPVCVLTCVFESQRDGKPGI